MAFLPSPELLHGLEFQGSRLGLLLAGRQPGSPCRLGRARQQPLVGAGEGWACWGLPWRPTPSADVLRVTAPLLSVSQTSVLGVPPAERITHPDITDSPAVSASPPLAKQRPVFRVLSSNHRLLIPSPGSGSLPNAPTKSKGLKNSTCPPRTVVSSM